MYVDSGAKLRAAVTQILYKIKRPTFKMENNGLSYTSYYLSQYAIIIKSSHKFPSAAIIWIKKTKKKIMSDTATKLIYNNNIYIYIFPKIIYFNEVQFRYKQNIIITTTTTVIRWH